MFSQYFSTKKHEYSGDAETPKSSFRSPDAASQPAGYTTLSHRQRPRRGPNDNAAEVRAPARRNDIWGMRRKASAVQQSLLAHFFSSIVETLFKILNPNQ
ncbi:hypothetical protein DM860_014797 [Cuscuta australis]|uniref:Uncharacterized protein n=1 Tax=Cuscuta australis TaxID=267555 RepID=A0A328D3I1_9ASTE|nr:hypothetical protein DM860_014797 [Cuscuta australis]